MHTHPAPFVSFFLKGSYTEAIGEPVGDDMALTYHFHDYMNYKSADVPHEVAAVEDDGAITLVFAGRRRPWTSFIEMNGRYMPIEH